MLNFVRYADDIDTLCESKCGVESVMSTLVPFIEDKLLLKVNREKIQTASMRKLKFLGYSPITKQEGRLWVHPKSVVKMKAKIKELMSRSDDWGNARRKEVFRSILRTR